MQDPSDNHTEAPAPASADGLASSRNLRETVRLLRLPPTATADRPRGGRLPWALCGLLAVALVVVMMRGGHGDKSAEAPKTTGSVPPPGSVAGSGDAVLESKGYIIPAHQIQVSPKVGGMILKLHIKEEGQRVEKDEPLAELETVDYKADRDSMQGMLDNARQRFAELKNGSRPEEIQQGKAEMEEAEANLRQLKLDFERNKLLRGDALSKKDFEAAEFAFRAAEKRLDQKRQAYKLLVEGPRQEKIAAAAAEVKQREADLAKAQWKLDNCVVRAPIKGTILTKKAEEGNIVNPAAFSNGLSASVCEMADLSDLEVDLNIQERDISVIFEDQRCRVRSDAYPDKVYEGYVSRKMPIADRAKGAIPVRVKVRVPREEEGVYLKPEMSVLVSFLKTKRDSK